MKNAPSSHLTNQRGQANVTMALALIILIVGGIWIWNHLDFDTQDFIVDEVVPILFLVVALTLITWVNVRKVKRAKNKKNRRDGLLKQFSNEKAPRKRFDLASQLIELNEFQLEGLERVAADMAEVFLYTFKRSLGDKQHRFRGMAASYLGVVQHRESIPLLIKALEDDHAYVRGCAALALGRMRATEAKTKLEYTMKEDWDQTVRSRSREAVERMS
ncbi:MAG: HEAT repeat domain-containing protein [Nitrospira sp. SB0677_bin_15]|nr:HEAT repeat domain-containing protein [Nitrospira sp. SB0667_bin_9]MYD30870.1 HEAT repeat domain-containing protein [Nitrospira sp. SB0661_bin_20]MYG41435.1 HEAT repeat domain-containing protein [Nitrospira sp. SB0677_bin_15]MYH01006.1 HEAT repeat domain-containing protein [Nitrospira sp. SB0675_bin_23]MYJ23421.1 HEAT repeat domain-containing protein [Nitrospira sp. SB0673_bin_12]